MFDELEFDQVLQGVASVSDLAGHDSESLKERNRITSQRWRET